MKPVICPACSRLTPGWERDYKTSQMEVFKLKDHKCEWAPKKLTEERFIIDDTQHANIVRAVNEAMFHQYAGIAL